MSETVRLSWKTVRDAIHQRILDSTYGPGDKLPKDEHLAAQLGCARTTVQRAMRDLSDSGIVERRRKGGTHVRADPVTRATFDIPITRREVEQMGAAYGYRLVAHETAEISPAIAAKFEMTAAPEMLHIEALHLADQKPYIYEDRWVSRETVPEIADIDLANESANEWLVRNRPYSRCDLSFYAIKADEHHAGLLETQVNEALFVMERTTWIGKDPITTVRAVAAPGYQLLTQI